MLVLTLVSCITVVIVMGFLAKSVKTLKLRSLILDICVATFTIILFFGMSYGVYSFMDTIDKNTVYGWAFLLGTAKYIYVHSI